MKNYDDIINLPHPTSELHPRMSRLDRAAQFSPFAALTGYEEAVRETARQTGQKRKLSEYEEELLSERIHILSDCLDQAPEVSITYFVADQKKSGGIYKTTTKTVQKIDRYGRMLMTQDGNKIPLDDILSLEGKIFRETEEP